MTRLPCLAVIVLTSLAYTSVTAQGVVTLLETPTYSPIGERVILFLGGQLICRWRLDNLREEDREICRTQIADLERQLEECVISRGTLCPSDPPSKPYLSVSAGGNTPGSSRTYSCTGGEAISGETVTVCKLDGTWSLSTLPTCSGITK